MFSIPLFQSPYDWITIIVGLCVTICFYNRYFKVYRSQQLLNSLPGIWTSLGLLFTFVAICASMQELQNAPSVDTMEGKVLKHVGSTSINITKIIGDIIPAFTTSIIGLVAGLIITIVNKYIYFIDEAKESEERDTPEDHIRGILEASNLMNKRMVELKSVEEQNMQTIEKYNKNLNNNVAEQNKILQGFIDGFVNRMDEIFTQMNGAIKNQIHEFGEEQFVKSSEVLNGIINKLTTQSTALLDEQKSSIEKMVTATSTDLSHISSKLSGVVETLSSATTEALKNLGDNQSAELQSLASKYDVLAERLVTQNKTFAEQVNTLMNEQFAAVATKNSESIAKMTELKDSYQNVCSELLNKSTQANEDIVNEIKGSFGTFVKELQTSMAAQCTHLSKAIADNVTTLNGTYSFMNDHLAEMVKNYEQSAEGFKDAVNVAHRTNESSENIIAKVTDALENMKATNENIEKVIASVATKQANIDKIVANIKELNSTIEALQQLESVLNRIARK